MTVGATLAAPAPVSRLQRPRFGLTRSTAALVTRGLLVAGAFAVLVLWWHDPANLRGSGAAVTAAGRVAGLLAAYLVLVQVLLLARLPWFERAVGFDRLAAWHRGLGTNVVWLLVAHVLLIVEGYALAAHTGPLPEAWRILLTLPDMLLAAAGLALFGLVAVSSGRAARRHLSYEQWYWVHVSSYLAIALAFLHQTSTGADFANNSKNRLLWTGMYVAVTAAVIVWRLVLPARQWLRHRMVVERVVPEGPGVVSVWIRGHELAALGAEAGQFLLWRFVTPGHIGSAHPYSLSARPDGRRLRITIKDAGDHSGSVAHVRPGTPVLAEGPFGHFTVAARVRRRSLLIAGGSGVGPVRALAEELADLPGSAPGDVVVLQRAGTKSDLVLGGELQRLGDLRKIVLHQLVGHRTHLGHDPLDARRLARLVPDLTDRDVFVCGPAPMTATVLGELRRLGVPARQQHAEDFSIR